MLCVLIYSATAFSLPTAAGMATASKTTPSPHASMNAVRQGIKKKKGASQTRMAATVAIKGGSTSKAATLLKQLPEKLLSSPDSLFNGVFAGLMTTATAWKLLEYRESMAASQDKANEKPIGVKELQIKFLSVFWFLRMADWLQGPYFYEVYASKILDGQKVSLDMVSKLFLIGFASTGLFGPWIGRLVDISGRKLGEIHGAQDFITLLSNLYHISLIS